MNLIQVDSRHIIFENNIIIKNYDFILFMILIPLNILEERI